MDRALISPERSLFAIDDARFWRRMTEQGLLFFTGAALVLVPNGIVRVLGVCIIGMVYARNLEFVHECLHGTALQSKRLGRTIGTLLALPMFVSFAQWRIEHGQHHRDVRREGFRYQYERLHSVWELFLHLLMVRHFVRAIVQIGTFFRKNQHRGIATDHAVMLGLLVLFSGISIALRSPLMLWLWLLPLVPAAIIHTHIELPEHLGCECTAGDAFLNSRVIPANRFVTWLVNANNYHALHHWNPRIPNDRLSKLPLPYGVTDTYTNFYRNFYRNFMSRFERVLLERATYWRLRRD